MLRGTVQARTIQVLARQPDERDARFHCGLGFDLAAKRRTSFADPQVRQTLGVQVAGVQAEPGRAAMPAGDAHRGSLDVLHERGAVGDPPPTPGLVLAGEVVIRVQGIVVDHERFVQMPETHALDDLLDGRLEIR
ncbi:MAG: hypothetical protein SVS15_04515, partial [Thermodesulfobacteriota bacterium]|nr:hypothetical protein [Thermodesulfobacteriota bacterium]